MTDTLIKWLQIYMWNHHYFAPLHTIWIMKSPPLLALNTLNKWDHSTKNWMGRWILNTPTIFNQHLSVTKEKYTGM